MKPSIILILITQTLTSVQSCPEAVANNQTNERYENLHENAEYNRTVLQEVGQQRREDDWIDKCVNARDETIESGVLHPLVRPIHFIACKLSSSFIYLL